MKVSQESMQSNTTPYLGYHMESDKNTIEHHKQEPSGHPIPAGDHKAAMNRLENMTITRHK